MGRRSAFDGHPDRPPAAGLRPLPLNGWPAGCRRDWRLPVTDGSVTVLRRGLRNFLLGATLSQDERYDLLLAAGEAASNAIEHADDPREPFFEVLATIGAAGVTIVVCDHGQWREAVPGGHRGRGMAMMRVLADTTVAPSPQGTTVTIRSRPRHGRSPVRLHSDSAATDGGRPTFGPRGP
jgi:anti-sigma regulatory factor (Ser/Thr protein kinase)